LIWCLRFSLQICGKSGLTSGLTSDVVSNSSTCVIKLLSITYLARNCWLVTDGGNRCVWLLTSMCVSRYSGSRCSVWYFSSCTVSSEFSLCGCAKIACTVCSCFRYSIISEGATHFLGRNNSSLGILALENYGFKW
jgi:hypothetical protein